MVKPSLRKEMAQRVVAKLGLSIRLACEIFGISETCYRHRAKLSNIEERTLLDLLATRRQDVVTNCLRLP